MPLPRLLAFALAGRVVGSGDPDGSWTNQSGDVGRLAVRPIRPPDGRTERRRLLRRRLSAMPERKAPTRQRGIR